MATKTAKKTTAKRATKRKATAATSEDTAAETTTKKAPAKRATKKAAPAKKADAKKTAPAKKAAAKKGRSLPREMGEHGFVIGSNSEKIANVLLEGGADRNEINSKVLKALGYNAKNKESAPNVSSLVSNILRKLQASGYRIESSWKVVAPTEEERAKAARAAKRKAKKAQA